MLHTEIPPHLRPGVSQEGSWSPELNTDVSIYVLVYNQTLNLQFARYQLR